MALPIRPPIQPAAAVAPRADVGRMAAQKAFFQAALAKAEPTAAAAAPVAPTASQPKPQAAVQAAVAPEDPPKKILRPGSLLDIRV